MSTQPQLDFMMPLGKKAASPEVCQKTGQQLKRRGMERSASKHSEELANVQGFAEFVAMKLKRDITIEDVRDLYGPWDLGNAAGSVFKGSDWECVGYREATRPEAHARILRVWRLKR